MARTAAAAKRCLDLSIGRTALTACDAAVASSVDEIGRSSRPILVLLATIMASGMIFFDGASIPVALSKIGYALSLNPAGLQWVMNAYMLPLASLSLLGGAIGDRYGQKCTLVGGVILCGIGALLCAFAPNPNLFFVARFIEGVGAAAVMPNSLAMVGSVFSGEKRAMAIGIWSSAAAVVSAVGPVCAGVCLDSGQWRLIFLGMVPLAVLAVALIAFAGPKDIQHRDVAVDYTGSVLIVGCLFLVVFVAAGGLTPIGLGSFEWLAYLVCAAMFGAFIYIERQKACEAVVPLDMFASPTFLGLTVYTLLLYAAFGVFAVLVPFVAIRLAGYSGLAAGAMLVPLQILMVIGAPFTGRLVNMFKYKPVLAAGAILYAGGFWLATRIDSHASYLGTILPAVILLAIGVTIAVVPMTTMVLVSVDEQHTATASGVNSATSKLAAVLAMVFVSRLLAKGTGDLVSILHFAMWVGLAACILAAITVIPMREPAKL